MAPIQLKLLLPAQTPSSREYVIINYERVQGTEEDLCKEIIDSGMAWFAVPDYIFASQAVPNDPYYSSYQWHHEKINNPIAWNHETGNTSILVAVCDSGFEITHPDLAGNLQLPGYNAVDGSANVGPELPPNNTPYPHGTQVAGCLGAIGNNSSHVAGVAWTTRILPVKIAHKIENGKSVAYYSNMRKGIEEAADRGAKVVNLSYGGCHRWELNLAGEYLRARDGLLFMTAGNNGVYKNWPDRPSIVIVGATDQNDARSVWPSGNGSNWGEYIDVVAPGTDICTLDLNGGVATGRNGTSYSCPMVAGLATLLWSYDPDLTPTELENIIFDSCVDIGAAGNDNVFGHGRIDAGAAMETIHRRWYIKKLDNTVLGWDIDWGFPGCYPVSGDYDGDGESDLALFNDDLGTWYIKTLDNTVITNGVSWGFPGCVAAPGDYNGSSDPNVARTNDLSVFNASTGKWYIKELDGTILGWDIDWGFPGCVPVQGDYDGDGKDDLALYDTASGNWYIRKLSGPILKMGYNWGFPGCLPVSGDYDGDGFNDLAVFDPATGNWYIKELNGNILANGVN